MRYFCVEYEECGFSATSYYPKEYRDLICPHCYSPLLQYPDSEEPLWNRKEKIEDIKRSHER